MSTLNGYETSTDDSDAYELLTCDEDEDFYDALEDTVDDLNSLPNESKEEGDKGKDENDVELETSWSFYFDRCVRGFSLNEYEANLKFIYKVETVQVSLNIVLSNEFLTFAKCIVQYLLNPHPYFRGSSTFFCDISFKTYIRLSKHSTNKVTL